MRGFKQAAIALLSLALVSLSHAEEEEIADENQQTPNLQVSISASFPSSEIFGIKLVNGLATEAVLSFTNDEPEPVSLQFVGGSLWTPDMSEQKNHQILRNLSTTVYKAEVPAGEKESFSYMIKTELHPADLVLRLVAVVSDDKGQYFTIPVFDEMVSVVEAPTSIFDPQIIFLYLMLASAFAGTSYFIYTTWVSTFFPQAKKRGGKGGERAKTSSRGSKKVDPSAQVPVVGDGQAVTSGAKAYDESWIPAHHIQRPDAKRARSGTPSGVKTKGKVNQ